MKWALLKRWDVKDDVWAMVDVSKAIAIIIKKEELDKEAPYHVDADFGGKDSYTLMRRTTREEALKWLKNLYDDLN